MFRIRVYLLLEERVASVCSRYYNKCDIHPHVDYPRDKRECLCILCIKLDSDWTIGG